MCIRDRLDSVVERHQAAGVADQNGERTGNHQGSEGIAQIGETLALLRLLLFNGGPERSRNDICNLAVRQAQLAAEVIKMCIRDRYSEW